MCPGLLATGLPLHPGTENRGGLGSISGMEGPKGSGQRIWPSSFPVLPARESGGCGGVTLIVSRGWQDHLMGTVVCSMISRAVGWGAVGEEPFTDEGSSLIRYLLLNVFLMSSGLSNPARRPADGHFPST